jgi:hypothetical protein
VMDPNGLSCSLGSFTSSVSLQRNTATTVSPRRGPADLDPLLLPRIADCTHRLAYTFLVLLLFWQLVPDTLSIARSSSNSGQVSLAELTSGRNAFTGAYSARGSQLRLGQNSYSLLLLLLVILLLIPLSRVSLSGRLRTLGL